ncbi:hypothetical protein ZWY2020_025104 [Hordeum vulgare]|nr:hypothetical protein ZWY2020_025104 [Hordeum vulgare]
MSLISASPRLRGSNTGCVINEPPFRSPELSQHSSGGSGCVPKKATGRKPTANPRSVVPSVFVAPAAGDLQAALGLAGVAAKARPSKATSVGQQATSARSKATLSDLSSLKNAQLHLMDKNLKTSGLDDGEIISMIRAREDAQVALAEAAATTKSNVVIFGADSTEVEVGSYPGGLVTPSSGGVAEAREAHAAPPTSHAPGKKRVE